MESKGNRNDWCRPFHLRTEFNSLHAHTHFSWNLIQCRRYTKCKAQQYTMSEVTTTCARIEKAKWHKMKKKIQLKMFENEYKPDWERETHSHTCKQWTKNLFYYNWICVLFVVTTGAKDRNERRGGNFNIRPELNRSLTFFYIYICIDVIDERIPMPFLRHCILIVCHKLIISSRFYRIDVIFSRYSFKWAHQGGRSMTQNVLKND